jgi:tight adherence protein B
VGSVCGAIGLGLLIAGRTWTSVLIARASRGADVEAMITVDILAAALGAGLSIPAALSAVGESTSGPLAGLLGQAGACLGSGEPWEAAWPAAAAPSGPGRPGAPRPAHNSGRTSSVTSLSTGRAAAVLAGGRPATAGPTRPVGQAPPPTLAAVRRALGLAWRSGVSAGPLLAGVVAQLRRSAKRDALNACARLEVQLMAPLGLCFLPAFMALGLAPIVISLGQGLLGAVFQV